MANRILTGLAWVAAYASSQLGGSNQSQAEEGGRQDFLASPAWKSRRKPALGKPSRNSVYISPLFYGQRLATTADRLAGIDPSL